MVSKQWWVEVTDQAETHIGYLDNFGQPWATKAEAQGLCDVHTGRNGWAYQPVDTKKVLTSREEQLV